MKCFADRSFHYKTNHTIKMIKVLAALAKRKLFERVFLFIVLLSCNPTDSSDNALCRKK